MIKIDKLLKDLQDHISNQGNELSGFVSLRQRNIPTNPRVDDTNENCQNWEVCDGLNIGDSCYNWKICTSPSAPTFQQASQFSSINIKCSGNGK